MQETLTILEENYGSDRDIEKDLGSYIVIVDSISDIAELKQLHLDVQKDDVEWVDEINTVSG